MKMIIGICNDMKIDDRKCSVCVSVSVTDFYRDGEGSSKYVEVDCTAHSNDFDTSLMRAFFSIKIKHLKDRWGFEPDKDDMGFMLTHQIWNRFPLFVKERILSIVDNCMTPDGRDKNPFTEVEDSIERTGIVFSEVE